MRPLEGQQSYQHGPSVPERAGGDQRGDNDGGSQQDRGCPAGGHGVAVHERGGGQRLAMRRDIGRGRGRGDRVEQRYADRGADLLGGPGDCGSDAGVALADAKRCGRERGHEHGAHAKAE